MEKSYTEIGVVMGNVRVAVRLPRWRLTRRKPRQLLPPGRPKPEAGLEELYRKYRTLWQSKRKSNTSETASELGKVIGSDWVKDFHQRYNPIPPSCSPTRKETLEETLPGPGFTSTPVNLRIRPLHSYTSRPMSTPAAGPQQQQQAAQQRRQFSQQQQQQCSWVPVNSFDVSGVKIYENVAELHDTRRDYGETERVEGVCTARGQGRSSKVLRKLCPAEETLESDVNSSYTDDDELNTTYLNDDTRGRLNTSCMEEEELMRMLSLSLLDDSYEIVSVADEKVVARAHFRPRSLKFPR
jgi:hypothetical protein